MSNTKLSAEAGYVQDPLALFYDLTDSGNRKNNILLESLEIHTKAGTQSILGIDSALRISSLGRRVFIRVLNENGSGALAKLLPLLPKTVTVTPADNGVTVLEYPETDRNQDEDSRLKALTVLDSLRNILAIEPETGSHEDNLLAGVFGYDLITAVENLPEVSESSNTCPDFCFYLIDTWITVNHKTKSSSVNAISYLDSATPALSQKVSDLAARLNDYEEVQRPAEIPLGNEHVAVSISDDDFCGIVEKMKGYIFQGDVFQVVPSRTFSIACPSPVNAYHYLKKTNPSPYMFYMQDEDFIIFGASPESSVKYTKDTNEVQMYPIAGTRGRGRKPDGSVDLDLDSKIELELRRDIKENAEHLMLVDLARNDIARISVPGTRYVPDLLNVDRYSHVMHLVSRVVGQLRPELDAIHAYQACLNMGTLTGAPKIRATEIIRATEKERRGSYGGAIGFLTGRGDMDTSIVIRSAFVRNGIAHVQAGCGVVYDSNPRDEAEETRKKAAAVLNAIALAHHKTLEEIQ